MAKGAIAARKKRARKASKEALKRGKRFYKKDKNPFRLKASNGN